MDELRNRWWGVESIDRRDVETLVILYVLSWFVKKSKRVRELGEISVKRGTERGRKGGLYAA
jgi:hypothetical protein